MLMKCLQGGPPALFPELTERSYVWQCALVLPHGRGGGGRIGRVPWAYWSASLPDLVLSRPVRETLSQKEDSGEAGIAPEESTNMNTQMFSNMHKSIATHTENMNLEEIFLT